MSGLPDRDDPPADPAPRHRVEHWEHRRADRFDLLANDRLVERRLPWKGLGSLVVVLALAYARQRWWL